MTVLIVLLVFVIGFFLGHYIGWNQGRIYGTHTGMNKMVTALLGTLNDPLFGSVPAVKYLLERLQKETQK